MPGQRSVDRYKQKSGRGDKLSPKEIKLLEQLDDTEVDALIAIDQAGERTPGAARVGAQAY